MLSKNPPVLFLWKKFLKLGKADSKSRLPIHSVMQDLGRKKDSEITPEDREMAPSWILTVRTGGPEFDPQHQVKPQSK